ncbi:chitobiase/beta-hexosaminidase C-terminal domain-containing protein [Paenibacillus protaetiae]|uniref:chitobiase/beta-hexosaminidase C-terminal domain-containing protein n=1 Tax=Paenibacillus protaetiae TaxID=2509456 RepID=UPI0013ED1AA8|nr:chitobiase/beta-hexosaminidase C-terminal domain-containing protein [Paenibacillus protaetiae]
MASGTSVTLSDATPGATIYYTTDGSTPTVSSAVYSSPISITSAVTIKAIAVKSGYANSGVMSASYQIALPQAEMPSVSMTDSGSMVLVALSTETPGATIYYTTDGNDPSDHPQNDLSTFMYNGPILIASSLTIKAIAVKEGLANSHVLTVPITVDPSVQPFGITALDYLGPDSDDASKSLLKVTFSKAVDLATATNADNYYVQSMSGTEGMPGMPGMGGMPASIAVYSADPGSADNEIILQVDSLADLASGTYITMFVHSIQSKDLSELIQSGAADSYAGFIMP